MKTLNYLAQNAKMKRSSAPIFNFGIPAYRSASGFVTCPMAGTCAAGCYAKQGSFVWPVVKAAYERRLALTKTDEFADVISAEIQRRKIRFVRIHDSGDFYSRDYFTKWLDVIRRNPSVQFYAYTKMVRMVKDYRACAFLPDNFTVIFSEGGKQDALIDTAKDRHSRVFPSLETLQASGYADTHHNDAVAFGENPRIGLVYHGAKSKAWQTDNENHSHY